MVDDDDGDEKRAQGEEALGKESKDRGCWLGWDVKVPGGHSVIA